MTTDTGESAAAIRRRADRDKLDLILAALGEGASLVYHPKINSYATKHPDDRSPLHGRTISPGVVRKMEKAGTITLVGANRYGLSELVE